MSSEELSFQYSSSLFKHESEQEQTFSKNEKWNLIHRNVLVLPSTLSTLATEQNLTKYQVIMRIINDTSSYWANNPTRWHRSQMSHTVRASTQFMNEKPQKRSIDSIKSYSRELLENLLTFAHPLFQLRASLFNEIIDQFWIAHRFTGISNGIDWVVIFNWTTFRCSVS